MTVVSIPLWFSFFLFFLFFFLFAGDGDFLVIEDSVVGVAASSFSVVSVVSFVVAFAAASVAASTVGSIVLWISCFCVFFPLVT